MSRTDLQRKSHRNTNTQPQLSTSTTRVGQKIRWLSITSMLPFAVLLSTLSTPNCANAMPLISEIYYDAVGSDNGQTFVEIYGDPGMPVDGLFLDGVNGANGSIAPTIALVGVFGPDGVFVIADDVGDGTSAVLDADQISNFDFQNGPDSIVLRDNDQVVDAVGYGIFDLDEVFEGEGNPAPDPPAGWSLARLYADLDTDDNASDFEMREFPNPGTVELLPIPEPRPIAMVTLGILALARSVRRTRRGLDRVD